MKPTVSIAQIPITVGVPEENIDRVREHAVEAARRGSHLLLLPELWATGYDLPHAAQWASPPDEGPFALVAQWARELNLWIVGSLLERGPEGVYNTAHVASPAGEIVALYRKIHLFPLMEEPRYLKAGTQPVLWRAPWGWVGLAICYDVRFPELFRAYRRAAAHMVLLPAEWPHPRLHHWRTLIQARAIENQYFLLAANRVGQSGETRFLGHSMIVSPWGEPLLEAGEQPVLLTTQVDLAEVAEARRRLPMDLEGDHAQE